jgi:hypothetical protein
MKIHTFDSFNENENWDKEEWMLRNDGVDYKGTIKDIVNMAKKYPIVPIDLDKIETREYGTEDIKRAKNANYTKFPIVVAVENNGDPIGVLDGNHRVFQAKINKVKTLNGYAIPIKDLDIYIV